MPQNIPQNIPQNVPPQVIFLDAVGTLFGVRDSVGEVYRQLAQKFGVEASAIDLNRAFFNSFSAAPAMAFPEAQPKQIAQLEFDWWQTIAEKTFQMAGVFDQFQNFPKFFQGLYSHFATADPWFVYADVKPALNQWRNCGLELGILSNFDSRIYRVLAALELQDFFTSVTISTEVGAAKPAAKIFLKALEKHNCSPDKVLHIGDSFRADYQGAKSVQIPVILLDRSINQDQSFGSAATSSISHYQSLLDIKLGRA
ncbi:MAG: HAD-IA family hydrolase [Oscillatoriales cyanobacterium RM2_1_1]|nr:HAD-IA family hydrolase [Oscillatoriales cyanobacterium SM2_3_0]NJO46257.1 HAD-IA family hydrolase [Oscillatoriales cyanobacterium RM2_1_1]